MAGQREWEQEPKYHYSPFSALPTSSSSCPRRQWGCYPALYSNSYKVSPKLSGQLAAKEHRTLIKYKEYNSPSKVKGPWIKGLRGEKVGGEGEVG